MKKSLQIAAAGAIALLLAIGWYLWGPAKTPAGQPPLVALTPENFDQFQTQFNEASDNVRVVLLLSPT